jgi:hypothetical protein
MLDALYQEVFERLLRGGGIPKWLRDLIHAAWQKEEGEEP